MKFYENCNKSVPSEIQLKFPKPRHTARHALPCKMSSQCYHSGYMQQLLFEFLKAQWVYFTGYRYVDKFITFKCEISSGFCINNY